MNYELFKSNWKKIFLIDMKKEQNKFFSDLVYEWIKKYIKQWKKIWVFVNKKWYSSWIICTKCWYIPQCDRCSVSISFHKMKNNDKIWLCHICKKQYQYFSKCPKCWSVEIKEYWLWTQKVAEYINKEFSKKTLIIQSEKANSFKKIKEVQQKVKDYQIIIWTSLLSVPIKWFSFDLIVILNADVWLNIPEYTSSETNFYFLYDIFKKHNTENYLVQTFNPQHHSIRFACFMNINKFFEIENSLRKQYNYPPFCDVCKILYKNEIEKTVFSKIDRLYKEILFLKEKYHLDDLEVYSTPALIYKIYDKYRYNIILKWKNAKDFLEIIYVKLELYKKWFKIDCDI